MGNREMKEKSASDLFLEQHPEIRARNERLPDVTTLKEIHRQQQIAEAKKIRERSWKEQQSAIRRAEARAAARWPD